MEIKHPKISVIVPIYNIEKTYLADVSIFA